MEASPAMNPKTWVLTVDRPIARFDACAKHLDEMGWKWERFNGLDNQKLKLIPVETFDVDRIGERIASKHVAASLSHYLIWSLQSHLDDEYFIVFEYDVLIPPDLSEKLDQLFLDLPNDWQVCFLGSCCCNGRPTMQIKNNVYEVLWPLCGHAILYKKSALPTLLYEQQRVHMPLDISLYTYSLPKLRTYTLISPLVSQAGTPLPP